jgi:uncharacterized protein YfdQ (DUF2303 family)
MSETITSEAIGAIEALTRKSAGKFELVKMPQAAIPQGLAVAEPTIGIMTQPNGAMSVVDLAPHVASLAGKPVRRKGTARATTLDSFIGLVQRHAGANTAIFADANWQAPKFTAVIDYHEAVADGEGGAPKITVGEDEHARFGQHRIVYEFPLSEAWKVWVKFDGKPMSQQEFAEFLEERVHELSSPTQDETNTARDKFKTTVANPTDLIELSRGLEVLVGARIKSKQNLASGEKQLVFETEHRTADGGTITVPGLFVLNVSPFYAGDPLRIFARLRYRPGSEGVVWFYQLYRPDMAIDERVNMDLETASKETGLPTFHGFPEV